MDRRKRNEFLQTISVIISASIMSLAAARFTNKKQRKKGKSWNIKYTTKRINKIILTSSAEAKTLGSVRLQ